jgi:hypothetical protein
MRAAEHHQRSTAPQKARERKRRAAARAAAPVSPSPFTGEEILLSGRTFASKFVYMSEEMLDALILVAEVSHCLDSFTTAPRILADGEKESGKTTLLDAISMLSQNAWEAETTQPALRAAFKMPDRPVLILDEISQFFGKAGTRGQGTELAKVLLKGYRRRFILTFQDDGAPEYVSAFCLAAFGGLKKAVPDDLRSRCIIFHMQAAPAHLRLLDSQDDDTWSRAETHRKRMHEWARANQDPITAAFRNMRRPHRKLRARRWQIWGPLFAVAEVAGGGWPARCLAAFKSLGLDATDVLALSDEQRVLQDTALLFEARGDDKLFGAVIKEHLRSLTDVKIYRTLSERGLSLLMTEALGPSIVFTAGNQRARGWTASQVLDDWDELEAALEAAQSDDADDDDLDTIFDVEDVDDTEVTEVTDNVAA